MSVRFSRHHRTSLPWKQTEAQVCIPWLDHGFRSELSSLMVIIFLSVALASHHRLFPAESSLGWPDTYLLIWPSSWPLWPGGNPEAVPGGGRGRLPRGNSETRLPVSLPCSQILSHSCLTSLTWLIHPSIPTATLCCQTKLSSIPASSLGPLF